MASKLAEKRNPIPKGVYWVDIFDGSGSARNLAGWNQWAKSVAPRVQVLKKERSMPDMDFIDNSPAQRMWVLFEVREPVPRWPASVKVGLPTRAIKKKKTTADSTAQRAPEEGVLDFWGPRINASPVARAIAAAALLYAVSNLWSRR